MKQQAWLWIVWLAASQVAAQYGPPPTKGKKHRTTTTTTEAPGAISNEISAPFPSPHTGPGYLGSAPPPGNNYWWQGPDSPFKSGSHPHGGCGGPGCAPPPSPAGCAGVPGGCGPVPPPPPAPAPGGCGGPAGCTGVGTDPRPSPVDSHFGKPVDIAQNPFLSSAILGKPFPQSPQGCQGGSCQYPGAGLGTGQYPGAPGSPAGSGPFPAQGTGPSQYPGAPGSPAGSGPFPTQGTGPSQYPGAPGSPAGSGPFPAQGTGPSQYPGQSAGPTQPSQFPGQGAEPTQFPGAPPSSGQSPGKPSVPLRPFCATPGHACVQGSECVGGVVTPNGIRQMRDPQVKECIPGLEVCCKLPPGGGSPRPQYGAGSTQRPYTGPLNTTPFPGCAAALKCVPETYCTAEGVMSDSPVYLTREQSENKVPLTECLNPDTGIIGKCCRDPNYKDPWPAGMMMMKNPGDFDDGQYHGEGSGPGVNIGPAYNTISSTPQSPAKDHGPKPSDGPGGFNKPFPPPFPGYTPSSPAYIPGRPQTYQPGQPTPSGTPYRPDQPGQPSTASSPYQPGQPRPSGTPYQPGQPDQPGPYQLGQPSGSPETPGQLSSTYQPGQPSPTGTSYQPGRPGPSSTPYQPGQASETPHQSGQSGPTGTPYRPGQPSGSSFLPGQPGPTGTTYQPTGSPYQPGQPNIPGPVSQPNFPGQETNYNLPTHPGQSQQSGPGPQEQSPGPQDQGPAPGSSCGIRRPGPGGDAAGFAEFPWQALVVSAGNRSLLCGAAIIADNAIITAAHCINQIQAKDLLVKAGEWKLLGHNPKAVQVRPVVATARHPGYDSGSLAKDLAILVVGEPFTFDYHVDKICIPPELGSEYFQKPGQSCLITGWGKNALQGPIQNSDLHKVDIDVLPAKQCEAKLKTSQNLGKYFILNEGFSCALPPSPTDLCKVDFGSAVACAREDGHYELAGVNSWDIACPTKQPLPSVFATSDAQWINTVLSTPTPVLQAQEKAYIQSLLKGESVDGVDIDDKPGFSQGYGK